MQIKKHSGARHWIGMAAAGLGITFGLALTDAGVVQAGPLDTRATTCQVNPGGNGPTTGTSYSRYDPSKYQIKIPINSAFIIPSQPAAGEILLSGEVSLPTLEGGQVGAGAPLIACPSGVIELFRGNGNTVQGMNDVYPTQVSGIGYRVFYYISSDGQVTAPAQFTNTYSSGVMSYPMNNSSNPYGSNMRTRIELVATGETIQPGTISAGQVFGQSAVVGGGSGANTTYYRVSLRNDITVSQPTCGITNPNALTVTLPDVSTRQLAATNVGRMISTTLLVGCNAVRNEAPSITLTTTNLATQTPGTLNNQITDNTAAKGVGVQVLYEMPSGETVPFEHAVATSDVGIPMGALPTDQWSFRLGAQFIRLGAPSELKAGKVRATATVTFTYH